MDPGSFFRLLRSRRAREAGFVLTADLLAGAVVFGLAATAYFGSAAWILTDVTNFVTSRTHYTQGVDFEDKLISTAASANAIFTPALDVAGVANCDANGNCHEVDFYSKDSSFGAHFFACSDAAGTSVQCYTYTDRNAGDQAANVAASGSAIPATTWSARKVTVDAFAGDAQIEPGVKTQITAAGLNPTPTTFNFGHASRDVIGGNYRVLVQFANDQINDTLALGTKTVVSSSQMAFTGTFLPTPPPPIQYSGNAGSLVFPFPGAPVQNFAVHEAFFHDDFTLIGSCTLGASLITSSGPTTAFPNPNPLVPLGQDSGAATFTMTPLVAGVCSQQIGDTYGQTTTESAQVMGPMVEAPPSMDFFNPSAPAQTGNVSKIYDNDPIAFSSPGCAGLVNAAQSGQSVPGSVSASPAITTFNVAPSGSYGQCTMTVNDQYGETANVNVIVEQALQVFPTDVLFTDDTQTACEFPDLTIHDPCAIAVSKWGYNSPRTFAVDNSSCGSIATESPGSLGAQGSTTVYYAISPAGLTHSGRCIENVSDDEGEYVLVTVRTADPPCPGNFPRNPDGTCSSPSPSPSPTSSGTTMYLTMNYDANQTLPAPYGAGHCAPLGFGAPHCPYQLGSIQLDLSHVSQPSICYIAAYILNLDNGGFPPIVYGGTSDILTPVAVYDDVTGYLFVPNNGVGSAEVWTPTGLIVSPPSGLPFEDKYYIKNLMPWGIFGASPQRYFWVSLSWWQLPAGAPDAGPDPPANTDGLQYTLGGGTPSECFGPLDGSISSVSVKFGPNG